MEQELKELLKNLRMVDVMEAAEKVAKNADADICHNLVTQKRWEQNYAASLVRDLHTYIKD